VADITAMPVGHPTWRPVDFALVGIYRYVITMIDTTGHGWAIQASFVMVADPQTVSTHAKANATP
jgi:hypothetical protein